MDTVVKDNEVVNFMEAALTWDVSQINYEGDAELKDKIILIDKLLDALEGIDNAPSYFGLSELEKEEAKKDITEIEKKLDSGEIDGMQYIDGKNEEGEDDILDAELFKASSIDSNSKDKHVYRPFNNA